MKWFIVFFLAMIAAPAFADVRAFASITLERTRCPGQCPVYRVVVFADGRVEYEGFYFVKTLGRKKARVGKEQLKQLLAELNRVSYFTLRDSYATREDGCPATSIDNPSAVTTVVADGKTKTVRHSHGCREETTGGAIWPRELTQFEAQLDSILRTGKWTGLTSPAK